MSQQTGLEQTEQLARAKVPLVAPILSIALPTLLMQFMQNAYVVIDVYWLGRLGAEAVAAVTATFPIIMIISALCAGVPVAAGAIVPRLFGAGDRQGVAKATGQLLVLNLLVSIVFAIVGWVASPFLLELFAIPAEVRAGALAFLQVSFSGFVLTRTLPVLTTIQRSINQPRLPLYLVSLTVLFNLVVAPVLIFGGFGIDGMGIRGAAWATVLAQGVASAVALGLLMTRRWGVGLSFRDFRLNPELARKSLTIGTPASVEQAIDSANFLLLMVLVASFGTLALATYGVGLRIFSLAIMPAGALAMAAAPLVAQRLGAGQRGQALLTASTSAWLGVGTLAIVGAIALALAPSVAIIMAPGNVELQDAVTTYVRITAFSFPALGLFHVLNGAYRGAGNTKTTMNLALLRAWILQLPLAYIFSTLIGWGVVGVWYSTVFAAVIASAISLIVFNRRNWVGAA